ncbi:MAG: hypothetical protein HOH43_25780 [Candidatus Latescibacteria bacterium]|nr:hypothetical protein [Candidatus Latescibacterota bacterium]
MLRCILITLVIGGIGFSTGCTPSMNPLRPANAEELAGTWTLVSAHSPGFPGVEIIAGERYETPDNVPLAPAGTRATTQATLIFSGSSFSLDGAVSGLISTAITGQYIVTDSSVVVQVIDTKRGRSRFLSTKINLRSDGTIEVSGIGPFLLERSRRSYVELVGVFRRTTGS